MGDEGTGWGLTASFKPRPAEVTPSPPPAGDSDLVNVSDAGKWKVHKRGQTLKPL